MNLDLTDDEAAALTQELHDIVENDRYPFSPRIRVIVLTIFLRRFCRNCSSAMGLTVWGIKAVTAKWGSTSHYLI
jgi:hypothetical protein